jgi:hypothetical protein
MSNLKRFMMVVFMMVTVLTVASSKDSVLAITTSEEPVILHDCYVNHPELDMFREDEKDGRRYEKGGFVYEWDENNNEWLLVESNDPIGTIYAEYSEYYSLKIGEKIDLVDLSDLLTGDTDGMSVSIGWEGNGTTSKYHATELVPSEFPIIMQDSYTWKTHFSEENYKSATFTITEDSVVYIATASFNNRGCMMYGVYSVDDVSMNNNLIQSTAALDSTRSVGLNDSIEPVNRTCVILPAGTYYVFVGYEPDSLWFQSPDKAEVAIGALPVSKAFSYSIKGNTVTFTNNIGDLVQEVDIIDPTTYYDEVTTPPEATATCWDPKYFGVELKNKSGKYTYKFTDDGEYWVRLVFGVGNTSNPDFKKKFGVSFAVQLKAQDTTKPTVSGVKNNKTYTKSVKFKVSDKQSGIKSVTLDGKKISVKKAQSGYTVSKKGSHALKVTDKSGNTKTVKFTIKKAKAKTKTSKKK